MTSYPKGHHPNSRQALRKSAHKRAARSQTPEAKAKMVETKRQRGNLLSPAFLAAAESHRMRGLETARVKAQSPSAKRKRAESLTKWRDANPGLPGSTGLTVREKVLLFFKSHPTASNAEVARALGITIYRVTKYRDPASRPKTKTQQLKTLLDKTDSADIRSLLTGSMPKCPECGKTARGIFWDRAKFAGRYVGRCECGRSFVLSSRARPRRPLFRSIIVDKVLVFIDRIQAGKSILHASKVIGIPQAKGDKIAATLIKSLEELRER